MTKEQAYHAFISGFGLPAYDENTVPENAALPRLTYSFASDEFGYPVALSISVWDRSTSWATVTNKANEIYETIGLGGKVVSFDDGYIWIKRGRPFSQRMADENDTIRRIYLNIEAEYFTSK